MAKKDLPSIDVVLEEARRKLDFQFEQLNSLDTKASIVLGVAGVVLTIVLTSLLSGHLGEGTNLQLAKTALVLIFVAFALSIVKLWIKRYHRPPKLDRLRSHYIVEDSEVTKLRIIDISLQAINDNDKMLNYQTWLVRCSYIILSLGLGLLAYLIWRVV